MACMLSLKGEINMEIDTKLLIENDTDLLTKN